MKLPSSPEGAPFYLLSTGGAYATSNGITIHMGTGGRTFIKLQSDGRLWDNIRFSSSEIPVGQWNYLTMTFDDVTGGQFYVNGVLIKSTTTYDTEVNVVDTYHDFILGASSEGLYHTPAAFSDVKFFDSALSLVEIETLYRCGSTASPVKIINITQSVDDPTATVTCTVQGYPLTAITWLWKAGIDVPLSAIDIIISAGLAVSETSHGCLTVSTLTVGDIDASPYGEGTFICSANYEGMEDSLWTNVEREATTQQHISDAPLSTDNDVTTTSVTTANEQTTTEDVPGTLLVTTATPDSTTSEQSSSPLHSATTHAQHRSTTLDSTILQSSTTLGDATAIRVSTTGPETTDLRETISQLQTTAFYQTSHQPQITTLQQTSDEIHFQSTLQGTADQVETSTPRLATDQREMTGQPQIPIEHATGGLHATILKHTNDHPQTTIQRLTEYPQQTTSETTGQPQSTISQHSTDESHSTTIQHEPSGEMATPFAAASLASVPQEGRVAPQPPASQFGSPTMRGRVFRSVGIDRAPSMTGGGHLHITHVNSPLSCAQICLSIGTCYSFSLARVGTPMNHENVCRLYSFVDKHDNLVFDAGSFYYAMM